MRAFSAQSAMFCWATERANGTNFSMFSSIVASIPANAKVCIEYLKIMSDPKHRETIKVVDELVAVPVRFTVVEVVFVCD
jgi:hypothetical protein